MSLSRMSDKRKSTTWLKQQLTNETSSFIPCWKQEYFFNNQKLVTLSRSAGENITAESWMEACFLLGVDNNDSAIFVVDLASLFDEEQKAYSFVSLFARSLKNEPVNGELNQPPFRHIVTVLDKEQSSILGYGKSLVSWHISAQYCGCCGTKTKSIEAGHSRVCQNTQCEKLWFPRTDPVVIMLVELQVRGGPSKCLLGGHHRTPDNLVTTLAGFVDPGESLEQAVKREVYEEAGIIVDDVEYVASQPWPFPNSLMIGFFAKAKSGCISIDPNELRHANWFTVEQVRQFSDWGDENDNIQIPKKESIARYLIDLWVEHNKI